MLFPKWPTVCLDVKPCSASYSLTVDDSLYYMLVAATGIM